jgi:hypothetical protein
MDDWDEPREPPSRPTLRPVFVAVLIVVACIALAVRTLQNMNAPTTTAPAEDTARETPRPTATVRKQRPLAVATPRPTEAAPTATPSRSAAPTPVPTVTPPPIPTPTPTLRPLQLPTAPAKPDEEASLIAVAPPKVKRGGPTVLDVRGRALRPDHRVIVLRGGRVPLEIGVPRQKLVDSKLIQVLIVVDAKAPKGEYDVAVVDGDGRRSNRVHFEVLP